jgi:hypothetical protein
LAIGGKFLVVLAPSLKKVELSKKSIDIRQDCARIALNSILMKTGTSSDCNSDIANDTRRALDSRRTS